MTTPINKFNPRKLRKADLVWLMENNCKHGHLYIEHPSCYYEELPDTSPLQERVGHLDIESSNLKASFGYVISWAIKEHGTDTLIHDCIKPREIRGKDATFDKRILESFAKVVNEFDKVCVFWGKNRRHDVPFLRHRCIKNGVQFPLYGEVLCIDMWDWCKNLISCHRNGLETVCREFGIPAKGHALDGSIWVKAMAGDKDALDYIMDHNDEDVICMEPLYDLLEPYVRKSRTSI